MPSDPDQPIESTEDPAVSPRFTAVFSIVAALVLLVLIAGLSVRGVSERWSPPDTMVVQTVDDSAALLELWEYLGVRNAVLVEVRGVEFGFQLVSLGTDVHVLSEYPFEQQPFSELILEDFDRSNALWAAAQRGLFRTIHYVLSPEEFELRVEQGRQIGAIGIAEDGQSVNPYNDGYWRHLRPVMPDVDEPVVMDIDVTYFELGDPDVLYQQLQEADLDIRVLTFDRSLDATVPTDEARAGLERFIELMGADQ